MDTVLKHYEDAERLSQEGNIEEALKSYELAFELVRNGRDGTEVSRRSLIARKLSLIYYSQGKDELARPMFELSGFPMPKRLPDWTIAEAIKLLKTNGLLSELTAKEKNRIINELAEECDDKDYISPLSFLVAYYCSEENDRPSDRSLKDGFFVQRWETDDDNELTCSNFERMLGLGPFKFPLDFEYPSDIAAFLNSELAKANDPRRFVDIEHDEIESYPCFLITRKQFDALYGGPRRLFRVANNEAEERRWQIQQNSWIPS